LRGGAISSRLVDGQGCRDAPFPGEAFIDCRREQICVAKRIANAEREIRVLVMSGITD